MATCVCRVCQVSVPCSHAVCLFSEKAERLRLRYRIARLLDLPLFEKDGLSEHICEKCKRRLERLAVEVSHNLDWLLVTARSLRGACVFLRSAVAPYTQAHCGEEPGVRGYRLLVTFT
jgi:hypothetical protein